MWRCLWLRLGALALVLTGGVPAAAQDRLALVVGNSAYAALAPLRNPGSDAALIGGELEKLGFSVTVANDLGFADFNRTLAAFERALVESGPDSVAFVFYAGHGLQIGDTNYLLPSDFDTTGRAIADLTPSEAERLAVKLDDVFSAFRTARTRRNFVVLDACRDGLRGGEDDASAYSFVGVEANQNVPPGTFVAYSTSPGSTASDGAGRDNSPYARGLARSLSEPGLSAEDVFKQTAFFTLAVTGDQQLPYSSSSLFEDVVFAPGADRAAANARLAQESERLAWDGVRDTENRYLYASFIERYPNGPYTDLAQAELQRIIDAQQAANLATARARATIGVVLQLETDHGLQATTRPVLRVLEVTNESPFFGQLRSDDFITRINRRPIAVDSDPGTILETALANGGRADLSVIRGRAAYKFSIRRN